MRKPYPYLNRNRSAAAHRAAPGVYIYSSEPQLTPNAHLSPYDVYPAAAPYGVQPTLRVPYRRPAAGPASWTLPLLGMLFAALLALIAAAILLFYLYFQASGRIYPGVRVNGIDLGGLTQAQAAGRLAQTWAGQAHLQVTNGMTVQTLAPAELGLSLEAGPTAAQAAAVGRRGSLPLELAQAVHAAWSGWDIAPQARLDEAAARAGLEALAPQMSQVAKNAGLRLEGTAFIPVPAEMGYTINVETTLAALRRDPAGVLRGGLLTVIPQPLLPTVTDVTPAIAQAQRLLDTPLAIQAYDPVADQDFNWPVPRDAIAAWLKVEAGEDGAPQIGLDEAQAAAYLDSLSATLDGGRYINGAKHAAGLAAALRQGRPYTASVSYRPTTYTIQPGDTLLKVGWKVGIPYWRIAKANPGLNPDTLRAGETLIIPPKDSLLPLPVVAGKRIVISISKQRLWAYQNRQLLGEHVISTGIDRSPTQPGIFQVQTHDPNAYASVWDLYMPNWLGIYEAWPGFMNGIHGLPTLSNGRRLWANVLGKPASYGCIILDLPDAEWLYNWAEDGVVVEIQP